MRHSMLRTLPCRQRHKDEDRVLAAMDLTWWGAMHATSPRDRVAKGPGHTDTAQRRRWLSPASQSQEE